MRLIKNEELKNMMEMHVPFVLIDARSHEEYEKGHLPGAESIPSYHLGKQVLNRHKKTDTIVTYCTDFDCEASTIAARKLENLGFTRVVEFKGGIKDWKEAGYPIEK